MGSPATSDELIELTMPWRGMNADSASPQLPPDMCANMFNYVTGEPGQVRLRNGLQLAGSFNKALLTGSGRGRFLIGTGSSEYYQKNQAGLSNLLNAQPVGVAVFGNRALITYGVWTDGGAPDSLGYHGHWLYNQRNIGSPNGGAQFRTLIFDADTGIVTEPVGDGTTAGGTKNYQAIWGDPMNAAWAATPMVPAVFGYGVPFDERVHFVTPVVRGIKTAAPIQSWAGAGTTQLIWAGPDAPVALDASYNSVSITVNNGATALLSGETANEITVLARFGLLLRPGASNNTTNSEALDFIYKVAESYSVANAINFTQEYGRGKLLSEVPNEAPANSTVKNFYAWPVQPNRRGPYGALAVNVFQGRLFAFAGTKAQGHTTTAAAPSSVFRSNIVQWSTGIAEQWLPQNYFVIDDASNDVIVGAGTVGDLQLILSHNTAYVMSGYDEDSFQLDTLSRHDGAVDPRGIRTIDDRLYWIGQQGLWSWAGRGLPVQESHPRSAVGIRAELLAGPLGTIDPERRTHTIGRVKDRVVFSIQPTHPNSGTGTPAAPLWVYQPSTGSFGKWGMGAYSFSYTLDSTNFHKLPWMFFDLGGESYAVGGTTVWNIDRLFDETTPSDGDTTGTIRSQDEYMDTADSANALEHIAGRIQFRDLVARPGRTVRVRSVFVEHACVHTDATKNAYQVKLGVDPDQSVLGTIGTGKARAETVTGAGTYDQGRYFTDRYLLDGIAIPLEGVTMRWQIDKDIASTYQNAGGHRLYRAYAMIEVTRNSRVDTTGA